jgi:hypothetical protein
MKFKPLIALLFLSALLIGCGDGGALSDVKIYSVVYEATTPNGARGATIGISDSNYVTSVGDWQLPYRTRSYRFKSGDVAGMVVQNYGANGNVIGTIYVDGKPWRQSQTNGAYGVVTLSGTLE